MYSNITEAWNNDPVKEMSYKLSNDKFSKPGREEIFNLTKTNEKNDYQIIRPPSQRRQQASNIANLSDIESINSISFPIDDDKSDFGLYAPVKFNKYRKPQRVFNYPSNVVDDISSETDYPGSKCTLSLRHLKHCHQCYDKLKNLIDDKINKKFDEMNLDNKMKQLQNMSCPNISTKSESWKEIMMIIFGAIVVIFIMLLIVRILPK